MCVCTCVHVCMYVCVHVCILSLRSRGTAGHIMYAWACSSVYVCVCTDGTLMVDDDHADI